MRSAMRDGARWLAVGVAVCSTAFSATLAAQDGPTRRSPALGGYFGILSEVGRFDGQTVKAAEEESGHFGLFVGRWSVGYVEKLLTRSVVVFTPGSDPRVTSLRLSGLEVGRLIRRVGPAQLAAYTVVGRARVSAAVGAATTSTSTVVLEPAISVGIAIGPVLRVDARAGARLGGTASIAGERFGTSGPFAGVRWSLGWLGDWRMRR